jgi:hypothetical protein
MKLTKVAKTFVCLLITITSIPYLQLGSEVSAQTIYEVGLPCNINPSINLNNINDSRFHSGSLSNSSPTDDEDAYKEVDLQPGDECNNDKHILAPITGTITIGTEYYLSCWINGINLGDGYNTKITIENGSSKVVMYHNLTGSQTPTTSDGSVQKGEIIATIGSHGCANGDHIHFEYFHNGQKLYGSKYAERANGSPLWEFSTNQAIYNTTSRVFPADVDSDGDDDLIAINKNGNVVYSISNGDGTFSVQQQQDNFILPWNNWFYDSHNQSVWTGNMDNVSEKKGADLIAIGEGGKIHYSLQDSNNEYQDLQKYDTAIFPWSSWFTTSYRERVWTGYINNDTLTDIVSIGSAGKISFSLNQGNGTFGPKTDTPLTYFDWAGWFSGNYNERIWVTDIDGQNGDDILAIGETGKIRYVLNNGDNTFGARLLVDNVYFPWNNWFTDGYANRVWPADVNGDGRSDLIGIGEAGKIRYVLAQASGIYSSTYTTIDNTYFPWSDWFDDSENDRVWPADINGDGRDDLIAIDNNGNINYVLSTPNSDPSIVGFDTQVSTFTGIIDNVLPHSTWFNSGTNNSTWIEDVNADNKEDIITINPNGSVYTFIADKEKGFLPEIVSNTTYLNWGTWFTPYQNDRVWSTDISGDNQADLLAIAFDGEIEYSLGDGSGQFESMTASNSQFPEGWLSEWFDPALHHSVIWPADTDGDGKKDIIAIDSNGDISVMKSLGNGEFEELEF